MGNNSAASSIPVSFKAVVFDDAGDVLLAKNSRQEWELPGGRPDTTDASPQHTVEREVREETGLQVRVRHIVDSWLFPVPGHRTVAIVTYLCDPVTPSGLLLSAEHSALRFFSPKGHRLTANPHRVPHVHPRGPGHPSRRPLGPAQTREHHTHHTGINHYLSFLN